MTMQEKKLILTDREKQIETISQPILNRMLFEGDEVKKEWLFDQLSWLHTNNLLDQFKDNVNELYYFLKKAYRLGYKDLTMSEIYAIPFFSKGRNTLQLIVDYHEYIKIAQEQPDYDGYELDLRFENPDGSFKPLSEVYCVFTGRVKNSNTVYKNIVFMREENPNLKKWVGKEYDMLQKAAIKRGLARMYPQVLGRYDAVEQSDVYKVEKAKVIDNE